MNNQYIFNENEFKKTYVNIFDDVSLKTVEWLLSRSIIIV